MCNLEGKIGGYPVQVNFYGTMVFIVVTLRIFIITRFSFAKFQIFCAFYLLFHLYERSGIHGYHSWSVKH